MKPILWLMFVASVTTFAQDAGREQAVPKDSVPQSLPCADQPKAFTELSDSFAAGRFPSPSEITGSWGLIGLWVHKDSPPSLNCNGIIRGPKLEWTLVANRYSVAFDAIGTNPQTTTFKPDSSGSVTFTVSFGGDYAPTFRCRITGRNTLACLGSPYYDSVEFKRMPVNSEATNGSSAETHQILNTALVPEQQTTLRVGESAVLRIPSDHEYSIVSTGDVLVPVRRSIPASRSFIALAYRAKRNSVVY